MAQSITSRSLWFTPIPIIISILVYIFAVPIYSSFLVYRAIVILIWKLLRSDLDSIVSDYDAIFTTNKPGQALTNISLCLVVDKKISVERIREIFQDRVVDFKNSQGELTFRRLFQTWTTFLGYLFWRNDTEFQLENHIRNYDYDKTLKLPKPSDLKTVQEIFAGVTFAPWKPNRSPWELLVVSDFNGHQTLLIFRIDHLLCDVYSIIGLFRVLFQSPFSTPMITRNNRVLSAWDKFWAILTLPYELMTTLPILLKGRFLAHGDLSMKVFCQMSQNVSISTIKDIKKKYNVEFATIMHSSVTAAIHRVFDVLGQQAPRNLDIATVVPLPDHPEGLCNHWVSFLEEYPCKSASSLDRLYRSEIVTKKYETSLFPVAMAYGLQLLTKLPVKIIRSGIVSTYDRAPSLAVSIFPTSTSREFIDGAEVVDAFASAGVTTGIGMGAVSWGVNNRQRLTFLACEGILKSSAPIPPESLSKFFTEELEKLHGNGSDKKEA